MWSLIQYHFFLTEMEVVVLVSHLRSQVQRFLFLGISSNNVDLNVNTIYNDEEDDEGESDAYQSEEDPVQDTPTKVMTDKHNNKTYGRQLLMSVLEFLWLPHG